MIERFHCLGLKNITGVEVHNLYGPMSYSSFEMVTTNGFRINCNRALVGWISADKYEFIGEGIFLRRSLFVVVNSNYHIYTINNNTLNWYHGTIIPYNCYRFSKSRCLTDFSVFRIRFSIKWSSFNVETNQDQKANSYLKTNSFLHFR